MEQNTKAPATHTTPIISIESIVKDFEDARMNDRLNALLNLEPPASWIKDHPFARDVKYLPIDKVEYLLLKIFGGYQWRVIEYKQIFNSVSVHGRLSVHHPGTGDIIEMDGLGAVGVQLDAGSSGSDMSKIKHDAIMKALPAAESYAKKDAAEHLGKIFGKDLSRRDTVPSEVFTKMAGRFNIDNPISPKNEG